ncbi:MAG: hypothetical protein EA427_01380 [Spirochaetaceae bacterium]|nr:MAG: hypothetical protein EA427_01380 [Spirochaetaceae bacterium]
MHQILPVTRIVHRGAQVTRGQEAIHFSDELVMKCSGFRNPFFNALFDRLEGQTTVGSLPVDERTFGNNIPRSAS